jgi:CDP-diacylglycerol pyrophosphatase
MELGVPEEKRMAVEDAPNPKLGQEAAMPFVQKRLPEGAMDAARGVAVKSGLDPQRSPFGYAPGRVRPPRLRGFSLVFRHNTSFNTFEISVISKRAIRLTLPGAVTMRCILKHDVVACLAILLLLLSGGTLSADPNALWRKVQNECVPNQQINRNPAPCKEVNLAEGVERGFVVFKDEDARKPHSYMLIPTRRITGIEDRELFEPKAQNYFEAAWGVRSFVEESVGARLTRDTLGLAVNSLYDRSQNQLHIHIDCVRPEIRSILREKEETLTAVWSNLYLPPPDHPYEVMKIEREELDGANPFKLLAEGIPDAKEHLGLETLVLIGAELKNGKPGFYLLSSRHTDEFRAHGEDLLDPRCKLADGNG